MVCMVHGHHIYKFVGSPGTGEELVLEKEPAGQSIQWICSGSDKGLSDSWLYFIGKLFTYYMVFYYMKGLCHLSYYWEKEEGKGLEVPCKHIYYYGSTKDPAFIWDLTFIFAIMLFLPATKWEQAFIQDQP